MESYNEDIKYLNLLSKQYPTIAAASTEIINLEAILNQVKNYQFENNDLALDGNITNFKTIKEKKENHSGVFPMVNCSIEDAVNISLQGIARYTNRVYITQGSHGEVS